MHVDVIFDIEGHYAIECGGCRDQRQMAPLRRAIELCTLKNTLASPCEIAAELVSPVPAGTVT